MSRPLVSIIIPCYRQGHYLGAAIESALGQSYPSIQVVVVNDGSDDDTEAVAARYAGRITYVFKPNGGLSSARNAGILAAEGDYLHFLDADDLLHPEAIASLVEAMDGKCRRFCIIGHQNFERDIDPDPAAGHLVPVSFACFPHLIQKNIFPVHSVLCRRDMVTEAEGFDENLRSCEDWDLWIRLGFDGAEPVTVQRVGAYYRRYANSMSTNRLIMLQMRTEVLLKTHQGIVGVPDRLKNWGTDLVEAEHRVLRHLIVQDPRSRYVMRLVAAIGELADRGIVHRHPARHRALMKGLPLLCHEHLIIKIHKIFNSDSYICHKNCIF